jgi:outer membrane protein OmpA-like peptidoglycan-associated protein
MHAIYSWAGSGVKGSETTAEVATDSLAPGTYTVKGVVKEGKAGKEGLKPWETAECSAIFTVKPFEPPTISCTASPASIKPGDGSTVTSVAVSPQNRPLTYSYSATSGSVNGSGARVEFNSAGAPTGAVEITCNVADDKGGNATANTMVTIVAPYVAPSPHAQALCSLSFDNSKPHSARVDNDAKACLDEVALDLQNQPDARVVVVGEATTSEKTPKEGQKQTSDLAAQRAVNAKHYLVAEKGIDPTRVSAVTGATDNQAAQDYLVPYGADFTTDVTGTAPVDETVVKPNGAQKPTRPDHAHKKRVTHDKTAN